MSLRFQPGEPAAHRGTFTFRGESEIPTRKLYPYASLAEHMLVGGELFLRCHRCRVRPVPHHWHFAAWCDPCLDDANSSGKRLIGPLSR